MSARKVVIIGAGGHAVSLTETVQANDREIDRYVDVFREPGHFLGRPLLNEMPADLWKGNFDFLVAIGDNYTRMQIIKEFLEKGAAERLPSLAHPTCSIAQSAKIAAGSVILQGAIVCAGSRIGEGCLMNTGSILEHEARLEAYSSLGPSASVGGRASIGRCSFVGMGAVVRHGIKVGDDTVIGAQAYVHNDLPSKVVAFGTPARVSRARSESDSYL